MTEKILILGSSAREHALATKLSNDGCEVFVTPGNAGTTAHNITLDPTDKPAVVEYCLENDIDLVIPGSEQYICCGLVDMLNMHSVEVFAPELYVSKLESSKLYAKKLMESCDIPTARFAAFRHYSDALRFVSENDWARVVKADGLTGSKGVFVCESLEEVQEKLSLIMIDKQFGDASDMVLLEERLHGEEVSFTLSVSDNIVQVWPMVRGYKRRGTGDMGPNTGGMGCITVNNPELQEKIMMNVVQPLFHAFEREDITYKGFLFIDLMVCDGKPHVLEFNVRLGDPEATCLLPLVQTNLSEHLIDHSPIEFGVQSVCSVVLAAESYPESSSVDQEITGLDEVTCYHAGTKLLGGRYYTNGGQIVTVVAEGCHDKEAIENVYAAVEKVQFEDKYCRTDISLNFEIQPI